MSNSISPTAVISPLADIEVSAKGSKIIIGAGSFVDAFVKMKFAGGTENIEIGENCYINSGCVLYSGKGIKIGNKVLIASNCTLAPINHGVRKDSSMLEQPHMASKGGIIIKDDVWIGANSVILDGAFIPEGVVIGAGAVVKANDKLEPYGIYAGHELKLIKFRT